MTSDADREINSSSNEIVGSAVTGAERQVSVP
jgi:hypothetical protein